MIKLTKDKISLADAFKVVEAVMKGEEIQIEGTSSYFTTSYTEEMHPYLTLVTYGKEYTEHLGTNDVFANTYYLRLGDYKIWYPDREMKK